MKILVCGGRTYTNQAVVFAVLTELHQKLTFTSLLQGGATGADTLALCWASKHGLLCPSILPDWTKQGKSGGTIRNQAMLTHGKPNLVLGFPGGPGTADMLERAFLQYFPTLSVIEHSSTYKILERSYGRHFPAN